MEMEDAIMLKTKIENQLISNSGKLINKVGKKWIYCQAQSDPIIKIFW